MSDMNPENNKDTYRTRGARIKELEKQLREQKKENIKLLSLCRRASEEIRDLDDHIINLVNNCEGAAKIIDYDIDAESNGYWSGMSSINLLNRLERRTTGAYVENYPDLHLKMKELDGWYQAEHPDFYVKDKE